jgi:AcrR family transcriptional regulator
MDDASDCHYARHVTSTTVANKALRADARRNYEALLEAGRAVFARSGADFPFEQVARQAGVGQGTLYRRFPTREHLLVAIMKDCVDVLDAQARELLDAPDPWQALVQWLRFYDQSATEYGGLSARIGDSLAEDGSPMADACAPMRASFRLIYDRARREGIVRSDVTADQVLAMVSALPEHPRSAAATNPYLDIVLRGLKP